MPETDIGEAGDVLKRNPLRWETDDPKEDWHIRSAPRSVKVLAFIQAKRRRLTVAEWLAIIIRAQEEGK